MKKHWVGNSLPGKNQWERVPGAVTLYLLLWRLRDKERNQKENVCKFVSLSSFSGIMARHAVPLGFECAFILALLFKMIFPRTHSLYTLCHFKTSMPLVF
jgi:hypothetical protein